MPVTIKVNGTMTSLVHKGSSGISIATIPDVCKTPTAGGPIPIPYPNIALSSMLAKGTTTVKVDGGMMAAVKGSEFSVSSGDEPGTVGGVKSNTSMKEATWILFSFDVKLDGKEACRFTDKMFHNHENTVNMGGVVNPPVVILPDAASGGGGGGETDPGDCTKEEHKKLQQEVNESKKDVAQGGACKESDSPEQLKKKGAAWLRQATARSKINNKCYKGGDDGHQTAAASAWEHVGKCQRIASGK
jgi:hypothetical protein